MTLIERAFNAFKFTLRIKKMLSVRSFINKLFININDLFINILSKRYHIMIIRDLLFIQTSNSRY